jgi:hypothetical protein
VIKNPLDEYLKPFETFSKLKVHETLVHCNVNPLVVPREGLFPNANSFVLDQLIPETKTDLNIFIGYSIKSSFILDTQAVE